MKRILVFLIPMLLTAACGNAQKEVVYLPELPAELSDQYFPGGGNLAGSHILIQFEGAQQAPPNVARSREEAKKKAEDVLAEILANPEKFEDLARGNSDGPMGSAGGNLGAWKLGDMAFAFDSAMVRLKEGQIGPNVVETPFGFHIIKRNRSKTLYYSAHAFLIGYKNQASPPEITRTKEEAAALANEISTRINGENFFDMAEEYADYEARARRFPPFSATSPQVPKPVLDIFSELAFNEVSKPLEMPNGFIFFLRQKTKQVAASHILIRYQGAQGQQQVPVQRTKEEARARADSLANIVSASPSMFDTLARTESDSPTAGQGGLLGVWLLGEAIAPEFDFLMEEMEIGDITPEPIETQFGFHIIRRDSIPE